MNFDLMRLIAALLVVVSHTFPLAGQPPFTISGSRTWARSASRSSS
jgi:peptidoglycan/LPS O-acetylase OafA/YrhL